MTVEWPKDIEHKPGHPMASLDQVKSLLAGLPVNNAFEALEKITTWLASVIATPGFNPAIRLTVIQLLDATGHPFSLEMQRQHLAMFRLQDARDQRLWQAALDFSRRCSDAYEICLAELDQHSLPPEQLALVCARAMRAYTTQLKIQLMRYRPVEQRIWDGLFGFYSLALAREAAFIPVTIFPNETPTTNVQLELLCALMLEVASPESLTPDQLELTDRITSRLAGEFDFLGQPGEGCSYFINLAQPQPPENMDKEMTVNAGLRFFGAGPAKSKLEQIIKQNELGTVDREYRFGDDYTVDQKLTVLRHLLLFWGPNPPRRQQERAGLSVVIDMVHDYNIVSKLITQVDFSGTPRLTGETAAKLKQQSRVDPVGAESSTETWIAQDVSAKGVGATVPPDTGGWVKIGSLCGLKSQSSESWWVGVIRRLRTDADAQNNLLAGIVILARKPVAVWLRAPGKQMEQVTEWATLSGQFTYDYLHTILLPDENQSFGNATILMASGDYTPERIFDVMMGEKSRSIKLVELLEQGEDFDLVSFQWLT